MVFCCSSSIFDICMLACVQQTPAKILVRFNRPVLGCATVVKTVTDKFKFSLVT